MTTHILISGVLHKAAETRVSKNGRQYALAKIRVKDGEATQWWQCFVFSESAQAELMKLGEGDALACQGVPKFELFRPETGEPRVSLSIAIDHVLALRQPPKAREKKEHVPLLGPRSREAAPEPSGLSRNGCNGDDRYGDEIPF
jgi:hypothetical protein